ncbi:MAG: hypothetical protein ACR2NB_13695 [Solirubrobacteraceae bacterium]
MTPEEVVAELRDLADRHPECLRGRIAALDGQDAGEALLKLVVLDAMQRAEDTPAEEPPQPPPADPEAFAAALDDAASVSAALASIDELDGLLRGVFDALSETEVRLVVFEVAFRALVARRRRDPAA